jgi:hypothetical protein
MTLIHEIAHLVAFEKYGRNIKPHGQEWKHTFQQLMVPYSRDLSQSFITLARRHFRNQVLLAIPIQLWHWPRNSTIIKKIKICFENSVWKCFPN